MCVCVCSVQIVMTCNDMCFLRVSFMFSAKHQGVHGSLRCTRTIVEIQHGLELEPIVTPTAFCNLGEGVMDSLPILLWKKQLVTALRVTATRGGALKTLKW